MAEEIGNKNAFFIGAGHCGYQHDGINGEVCDLIYVLSTREYNYSLHLFVLLIVNCANDKRIIVQMVSGGQ